MFAFAHDLRSYLRTVVTRLQLVLRGAGESLPEEDRSLLKEAETAAGDMGALLNAMVAYCNVEPGTGQMAIQLLIQGTLMERKAALAAAGAQVDVSNELDQPAPVGLQNILKELLTNACKFRDTGRSLRIALSTRILPGGTVEIAVTDNGTGVAPGYLEKIFVPFQRLHSKDEVAGHGLGLATCRRIAATWGGSVTAETAPGNGLTVLVTVPAEGTNYVCSTKAK